MAEGVLAFLSKLFNWHAARDDDFISPVIRGMGRSKAEARDRILTDDEIRKVWLACEGVYGRYIKFLLLTAVRRNEAAKAEWSEVTNSTWIVPAARMKGKLDHVVPLSPAAIEAMGDRSEGYVFTVTGKRPFNDFDDYKRELDKASGVKGWTLHDLRRTARSLMSRAGVSPDIAERCLAHTIPGVRGVYDRYEYLDEKREALGRLARLVGEIVNG
jgi:integrase